MTREPIVDAALRIADSEGADAVSMRRVARELGVGTMTLYTHVKGKSELLDLMYEHVAHDVFIAEPLPGDWRQALKLIAKRTRSVSNEHPWIVTAFGRYMPHGAGWARHLEQSLSALEALEIDFETKALMWFTVDNFTFGFCQREVTAHRAGREDVLTEKYVQEALRTYLAPLLATGELPNIARALEEGASLPSPDVRFERGLDILLEGMASVLLGETKTK